MRFVHRCLIGCCVVSWLASPAMAQAEGAAAGTQDSWVVSYALVILSIGLAVFIISKPARREK